MPSPLDRQRLRVKANPANFEAPQDVRKNGTLELWSGSAARIEVGVFFDAAEVADVSNLSFITLEIKPTGSGDIAPAPTATPDVQKIIASAALNAALTTVLWTAGATTDAHAVFLLSDAETNFSGNKWILCYATTTAGHTVTLFAGLIAFRADGGPSTTTPDPVLQDAWTKAESDARFGALGIDYPRVRLDITALTGGGAGTLDGLATTSVPVGYMVALRIGGVPHWYILTAGTTAEASPSVIRPDDYHASTNAKVWLRYL